MWERRIARVNELLLHEIARYVLENQPPEMGFVTFTGVSVTEDLQEAKVFYSVLGTPAEQTRTAELLKAMRSDLTRDMRRLESLKRLPELTFVVDDTPVRAARVHEIIQDLKDGAPPAAKPPKPPKKQP